MEVSTAASNLSVDADAAVDDAAHAKAADVPAPPELISTCDGLCAALERDPVRFDMYVAHVDNSHASMKRLDDPEVKSRVAVARFERKGVLCFIDNTKVFQEQPLACGSCAMLPLPPAELFTNMNEHVRLCFDAVAPGQIVMVFAAPGHGMFHSRVVTRL